MKSLGAPGAAVMLASWLLAVPFVLAETSRSQPDPAQATWPAARATALPACTIVGTAAAETLVGTPGDDVICALGGNDRVRGGGGDDVLFGSLGDDSLRGGRGNDRLYGHFGADRLRGARGRDFLQGGGGADLLSGGPGADIADYGQRIGPVRVSLGRGANDGSPGEGDSILRDVERARGGAAGDTLIGNARGNRLYGGGGDDTLDGRRGNDRLRGGAGVDRLDGRDGARFVDGLRCGPGQPDVALANARDTVAADCEVGKPPQPQGGRNNPPTDILLSAHSVAEERPVGTVVGTLDAADEDAGDTHTFTLVNGAGDADNAAFTIAGDQLRTAVVFDFEVKSSFTVRVRVTDARGAVFQRALAITVTDVQENRAPTDVSLSPSLVAENEPVGMTVGSLAATDADAGDSHTFALVSGAGDTDNLAFTIGGGQLKTAAVFDFEVKSSYSIRVRATDSGSPPLSFEKQLTVTITDANDAPVVTSSAGAVSYTEGDPATVIDSGLTVADADDASLEGAQVRISAGFQSADQLLFSDQNGITGSYDAGTGVLTLTGTSSVANYQAALRSVEYRHTGDDPSAAKTVEFRADDGDGLGPAATRNIDVTPVDDSPTAVDDSATVTEDAGASAIVVLANDANADGGPLVIASASDPANGTVVLTGGTLGAHTGLTYQPDAGYCNDPPGTTPDTFAYTLNGGSTATVSVTVTCADDAPTAVDDSATVGEDSGASAIDVLANDTDTDAGPKTVASVTQPANGAVVITGGGTGLTYQPGPNYCNDPPGSSPDTFTYTLNGGSSASVSVKVTCVDDAPIAVNDSATVAEDSSATAIDVLANDDNDDGGPMSVGSVTQPADGAVVITGGGAGLTYQPDANYCNDPPGSSPDTFTYTVNGGSTATVSVTVTCVDDPPTAVDDSATVTEDAGASAIVVLANDANADGGPLVIASASDPANGTVVLTGGTLGAHTGLTYQPDAGYCNDPPGTTPDTFAYTLNGGSTATVSVTVTCADDAPTAVDDSATVGEDSGASAIDVLANDTDTDAGPKTVASVTQPANGAVVITGGGTGLTYQPGPNYCNDPPGSSPDTFTYTLNGGSSASVSVKVTCVDDAPIAVNDSATVAEDSSATAIDVLANDDNDDGGPMSVGSVTQPADGAVVITGGGAGLTYQPDANYCNDPPGSSPDTFTYTVNGGSTATVSVTVTCVDDPPTAVDDDATVAQDSTATAIDVLANDLNADGGPMAIASASDPAKGTVMLTGGTLGAHTGLTYQPDAGYCNDPPGTTPDTFAYTLNGGSTATVSVKVTCPDAPPTAVADSATFAEDAAATAINVLANDTDPDGGPKVITLASDPANGTVVLTGGSPGAHTGLTYEPAPNYCNDPPGTTPDTFTYTLNGGSTATVSVTVTCVDDIPLAVNDSPTVAEDAGATVITVLANDTDVDGGPKTISSASDPANGTVVLTGGPPATGLTYQPDANYCNNPPGTTPDTFTYTLNGGSTATVSVTVTCVPDNPVVDTSAGSTSYTENAAATAVDAAVTVTDPDAGTTITGATVQISGNFASGQDVLALAGSHPGIGASFVGDTLTLTGNASPAAYQSALRDVTYSNSSENPSTAPRTVTFTVTDDTARSGSDTKGITVIAVDDPPVAVNDSATVLEDAAPTAITVLTNDTDVDAGPKTISSASDPANGTVALTGGPPATGLTYQPDANYCNDPPGTTPDTFTYTLNGGSTATVSVTVTCVNDAPVADDETFNGNDSAHGNTAMVVNDPDDAAPNPTHPHSTVSGDILAGDTDIDGPGPLTVTPGTFATNDGGSVTIEADGDFTFHPVASTSCTDTSDFFDYTVEDSGSPELTDIGRVTIAIAGCVWYVSNNAPGNSGTSALPFDTLAQAEAASGSNHTVFVFDGDNTSTGLDAAGYAMNSGERLIGEHEGLVVDPDGGGALTADTLHPANPGAHPTLTATNADVIDLDDGNEVRGFNIDPSGTGGGIAGTAGDTGGGTIDDVNVVDTLGASGMQAGLELNGTTGTFNISNFTVTNNATGVLLNGAGTVSFAAAGTVSIASAGARGLDATGTSMGASTFDSVTVTGSGGGGVSLTNTTGTTTFGDLSLTTTSGGTAAFGLSNAGSVSVPAAGTANVSATGGPAVDVTRYGRRGARVRRGQLDRQRQRRQSTSPGSGWVRSARRAVRSAARPGSRLISTVAVARSVIRAR